MPDRDAIEMMELIRELGKISTFIAVTGAGYETTRVESRRIETGMRKVQGTCGWLGDEEVRD